MGRPFTYWTALLALASALLLSACGKETKRPNADAVLTGEAIAVAEGLRNSYQEGRVKDMKEFCTEGTYDSILRDLKKFQSVELTFTPRWSEIKLDGTVYLNVQWEGTWTLPDGQERVERGMAVFEFKGRPLKLDTIHRSSPFSQPEAPAPAGAAPAPL